MFDPLRLAFLAGMKLRSMIGSGVDNKRLTLFLSVIVRGLEICPPSLGAATLGRARCFLHRWLTYNYKVCNIFYVISKSVVIAAPLSPSWCDRIQPLRFRCCCIFSICFDGTGGSCDPRCVAVATAGTWSEVPIWNDALTNNKSVKHNFNRRKTDKRTNRPEWVLKFHAF